MVSSESIYPVFSSTSLPITFFFKMFDVILRCLALIYYGYIFKLVLYFY